MLQLKEEHHEAVTKHLSAAARQRQAAHATVLHSIGVAALLPLHVLGIIAVSLTKVLWSVVLFLTFLLPPILQAPLALVIGAMLLYANFLGNLSAGQATGIGISLSAFVLVPMIVRFATAGYYSRTSVSCASAPFPCATRVLHLCAPSCVVYATVTRLFTPCYDLRSC